MTRRSYFASQVNIAADSNNFCARALGGADMLYELADLEPRTLPAVRGAVSSRNSLRTAQLAGGPPG